MDESDQDLDSTKDNGVYLMDFDLFVVVMWATESWFVAIHYVTSKVEISQYSNFMRVEFDD